MEYNNATLIPIFMCTGVTQILKLSHMEHLWYRNTHTTGSASLCTNILHFTIVFLVYLFSSFCPSKEIELEDDLLLLAFVTVVVIANSLAPLHTVLVCVVLSTWLMSFYINNNFPLKFLVYYWMPCIYAPIWC
jgi:hypothetical protein